MRRSYITLLLKIGSSCCWKLGKKPHPPKKNTSISASSPWVFWNKFCKPLCGAWLYWLPWLDSPIDQGQLSLSSPLLPPRPTPGGIGPVPAGAQGRWAGQCLWGNVQGENSGTNNWWWLNFPFFFQLKMQHFRLFLGFVLSNCNIINKDGKTPFYKILSWTKISCFMSLVACVAIPSPVFCGQVISLLEAESLETSAAEAVPGARWHRGSTGVEGLGRRNINGWGWKL